jgi:hypothetical protein
MWDFIRKPRKTNIAFQGNAADPAIDGACALDCTFDRSSREDLWHVGD